MNLFVPLIQSASQSSNETNCSTIKHKQFVCSVGNDIWESTTPGEDNTLESYGLELRRPPCTHTHTHTIILPFTVQLYSKCILKTIQVYCKHCCLVVECSRLHFWKAVLCISCNRFYWKYSSNNKFKICLTLKLISRVSIASLIGYILISTCSHAQA